MGYTIQYGQTLLKEEIKEPCSKLNNKLIPILLITSCTIAAFLIYAKADFLRDIILPGNADVTEAALGHLAENLRSGETFGSAITAFCREIIINANIAW